MINRILVVATVVLAFLLDKFYVDTKDHAEKSRAEMQFGAWSRASSARCFVLDFRQKISVPGSFTEIDLRFASKMELGPRGYVVAGVDGKEIGILPSYLESSTAKWFCRVTDPRRKVISEGGVSASTVPTISKYLAARVRAEVYSGDEGL